MPTLFSLNTQFFGTKLTVPQHRAQSRNPEPLAWSLVVDVTVMRAVGMRLGLAQMHIAVRLVRRQRVLVVSLDGILGKLVVMLFRFDLGYRKHPDQA